MNVSQEDYIKAIYKLQVRSKEAFISTNAIAKELGMAPASVTEMIKKLTKKELVNYVKYQGVELSKQGNLMALKIIRKHRLWEVFLFEKLAFNWDEVHDIAEQLEHIQSPELTNKLDAFLGFPENDPHGDPIPDKNGKLKRSEQVLLASMNEDSEGVFAGLINSSDDFLKYLDQIKLPLGTKIKVVRKFPFDNSVEVKINNKKLMTLSSQVAMNLKINEK